MTATERKTRTYGNEAQIFYVVWLITFLIAQIEARWLQFAPACCAVGCYEALGTARSTTRGGAKPSAC